MNFALTRPNCRAAILLPLLLLVSSAACSATANDSENFIANGDAETLNSENKLASWSMHLRKGSATLSQTTDDKTQGNAAARIELGEEGANLDIRIGQNRLKPVAADATYLFSADVKTEYHKAARFAGYFAVGVGTDVYVGKFDHNAGWQKVELPIYIPKGKTVTRLEFSGGRTGPAVILIDNARLTFLRDGKPKEIERKQLAEAARVRPTGTGIKVKPNVATKVTKLLPTDSRVVRGFTYGPIDGRDDTRYASGVVSEWSGYYGSASVNYRTYNGNNGLHITLPDGGFDAVQVAGEWEGSAYANHDSLLTPGKDVQPLFKVEPVETRYQKNFSQRTNSNRVSFFYPDQQQDPAKRLRQVTFLRVDSSQSPPTSDNDITLHVADKIQPTGRFAQGQTLRSETDDHTTHLLADQGDASLRLAHSTQVHLLTQTLDTAHGLSAVTIRFKVADVTSPTTVSFRVQDVLDHRREVMASDIEIASPGSYTITLDHPDQVFLPQQIAQDRQPRLEGGITPEPKLWLSLIASSSIELNQPTVTLHRVAREQALVEAAQWRKMLVRGAFQCMSEPRPWMHLKDGSPLREQIHSSAAIKRYIPQLEEVLENIEIARLLLPNDDVIRQYHEWVYQNVDRRKPQPPMVWPDDAATAAHPMWAVKVRETWLRVSNIANWWLDNRLVDNGEIGGGINDDTDMFQTWAPLPMIESEPLGARLKDMSARLTDVALEHKLEEGVNTSLMDSLHAYEEGINQLALNAWWFYGDPVHFERAMVSSRTISKWFVETEDGRLHIGGNYMSLDVARHGYESIGKSPGNGNWAPARLILHPMYVVGLYNRNPIVVNTMTHWGKTWRDYQKHGHYVGQVDIKTGEPTIVSKMPSAAAVGPVDEWLAIYHVTGDPAWLEPYTFMMDSGGYTGTAVRYGRMPQTLVDWPSKYQQQLRDRINHEKSGYAGFFLHKNRDMLQSELDNSAAWFSRFPHMDTAAEQKTDRVLTYKATVPLSCYLGDAPNRNRWLNFSAVSYENLKGEDFAALVWDAGADRLKVALYNFTDKPLNGVVRTWRLDHGEYEVKIGPDQNDDGEMDRATSTETKTLLRYSPINITLQPKQIVILEVRQNKKLDDIRNRADVAVSPLDTKLNTDGSLTVPVHNIGSIDAQQVTVELHRNGKQIASKTIEKIEAPLDLHPRMVNVTFDGAQAGDTVVVDRADTIPEIAEHNNRLTLSK